MKRLLVLSCLVFSTLLAGPFGCVKGICVFPTITTVTPTLTPTSPATVVPTSTPTLVATATPTGTPPTCSCTPGLVTFTDGFEDDFIADRSTPDHVDAGLSNTFSPINQCRPAASGFNTLRDRDITSCGAGGGFTPIANVAIDLTDGNGVQVTFRYDLPNSCGTIAAGSTVSFDVANFGSDPGSVFKYLSTDGVSFAQVGDASDTSGTHTFPVPPGGNKVFLRVVSGSSAGIFEGVWVDNFSVALQVDCP
jgi:hypothetical protein